MKVKSIKKGKKTNKANIQPARSIQDLLYGQKITFSCRTNVGDLEWAR